MEKQVSEGSLHKWFKGSKSKDGKGGWVNVVTGGTCASDEPGEGTPKCVSSAKRASMTKAERLSAARRKKKADPNQQQKSGAAKPTYVSTDSPRKKKKKKMNEGWSDKYKQSIDCDNPKGFSQKAHCQGKKKMKETYERTLTPLTEKAKKCWPGYEKKGTKKMFGKTYNNCVKKEEVVYSEAKIDEKDPKNKRERRNVSKFGPQTKPYDPDTKEMKTSMSKHMQGMRQSMHKSKRGRKTRGPDAGMRTEAVNAAQQAAIAIAKKKKQEDDMVARKKKQKMYAGYEPEGETISEVKDKKGKGSGTKDACYHKVKSRYSVWPSAYASGALVKCRKVGAANWGNSSKKEDFSDWKSEFIWEDGDSSKKIEETVGTIQKDKFKIKPGVKGDGFLGPTVGGLGVPNPIRITQDVVDTVNRSNQNKVDAVNKELPGSASMGKFKEFNKSISPATKKLLPFIKSSYDYEKSDWRSDIDEDWQKTNRQDKTDGMSQKAVNAYRRENPGSKLKTAVTQKPSTLKRGSKKAKRRKSFCSRMKGMKKRLTSAKTARDPNSRINKALRRWNC